MPGRSPAPKSKSALRAVSGGGNQFSKERRSRQGRTGSFACRLNKRRPAEPPVPPYRLGEACQVEFERRIGYLHHKMQILGTRCLREERILSRQNQSIGLGFIGGIVFRGNVGGSGEPDELPPKNLLQPDNYSGYRMHVRWDLTRSVDQISLDQFVSRKVEHAARLQRPAFCSGPPFPARRCCQQTTQSSEGLPGNAKAARNSACGAASGETGSFSA